MKKTVLPFALTLIAASTLVACGGDENTAQVVKEKPPAQSINPTTSGNSLASADQISAEKNALTFINTADAKQGLIKKSADLLKIAKQYNTPIDTYNLSLLPQAVQESAFAAALSLYNTDHKNEKIISILAAPHHWFGVDVLGSRTVFDNPDTTYRVIPIDRAVSYIIKGAKNNKLPLDVNFSVWDAKNQTLFNLATADLKRQADGSFEIYVTSQTAPSHYTNVLQLPEHAVQLFIRNTLSDWKSQQFDKLTIERADGSQRVATSTQQQQYAAFLKSLETAGGAYHYYYQLSNAVEVNTLPHISLGGAEGRLSTQAATYSAFEIADDEALIFHTSLGDANYFILPVYNQWFITTDYINTTQTLNHAQSIANADGSFTYVIAKQDPGVYNWVSTDGLNRGYLNPRWQGLSGKAGQPLPTATLKKVKLKDLKFELSSRATWVTTAERQQQLAERKASYLTRYQP